MEEKPKPAKGKKKTTRSRKKKNDEVNDEQENEIEEKEAGSAKKPRRVNKVAIRRRSQKPAGNIHIFVTSFIV